MDRQRQQQTIATLIALLIVTEIILHFCWKVLDAWIFSDFTVTAQIAIVSAIILFAVLYFREELFLGFLGGDGVSLGRKVRGRYGHHYAGFARAGSFGVVEALIFIAYVFCAGVLIGLINADIGMELKTIGIVAVVVAGLILLAQKAHLKFTALEMVTFAISVALPIMASGVIPQVQLPADWLSTSWNKIVLWGICCVSAVIMAFQD